MSADPIPPDAPDPVDPLDIHGTPDASLAGYLREHNRPPAFDGADGSPYTVSPEAERTPDLRAPWIGYLVFPRWAATGVGVVGHLESGILARGISREAVLDELGALPLARVREILDGILGGNPDEAETPDDRGADEWGTDDEE